MLEHISLALVPDAAARDEAGCFVVVDALRATTTIATLFACGVRSLWVAADILQARLLAYEHDATLMGEVNGLPPEGFAFGNSPVELLEAAGGIKHAVLFTTNGTRALCGFAAHGKTYAAALGNAGAVAAAARAYSSVTIVCAGESVGRRFALEDFAVAAAIVHRLHDESPGAVLDDGASLAMTVGSDRVPELIRRADHAGALRRLGLADDIDFACQQDMMICVPEVVEHGPGWALLRNAAASGSKSGD